MARTLAAASLTLRLRSLSVGLSFSSSGARSGKTTAYGNTRRPATHSSAARRTAISGWLAARAVSMSTSEFARSPSLAPTSSCAPGESASSSCARCTACKAHRAAEAAPASARSSTTGGCSGSGVHGSPATASGGGSADKCCPQAQASARASAAAIRGASAHRARSGSATTSSLKARSRSATVRGGAGGEPAGGAMAASSEGSEALSSRCARNGDTTAPPLGGSGPCGWSRAGETGAKGGKSRPIDGVCASVSVAMPEAASSAKLSVPPPPPPSAPRRASSRCGTAVAPEWPRAHSPRAMAMYARSWPASASPPPLPPPGASEGARCARCTSNSGGGTHLFARMVSRSHAAAARVGLTGGAGGGVEATATSKAHSQSCDSTRTSASFPASVAAIACASSGSNSGAIGRRGAACSTVGKPGLVVAGVSRWRSPLRLPSVRPLSRAPCPPGVHESKVAARACASGASVATSSYSSAARSSAVSSGAIARSTSPSTELASIAHTVAPPLCV
mmetsp:Transcript_44971/g.111455  ORF Transcript_44971/g.111455 Transcript_44971/m.111455 type:complete len:508 (-) Transcript_44971:83-1606(-)